MTAKYDWFGNDWVKSRKTISQQLTSSSFHPKQSRNRSEETLENRRRNRSGETSAEMPIEMPRQGCTATRIPVNQSRSSVHAEKPHWRSVEEVERSKNSRVINLSNTIEAPFVALCKFRAIFTFYPACRTILFEINTLHQLY